jgi:hypothetical protein
MMPAQVPRTVIDAYLLASRPLAGEVPPDIKPTH